MDFLLEALTNWLKEMLVGGIMSNLSGMFDSVNQQVADISVQVGQTPQGWNGSIFNMIENLSNSIMVPIAGVILAIVMTVDLIQMIADKNNLHDVDTWMIFKWVFKSAAAILIVTNTWNIVMGVFELAPEGTGYRARTRFSKFFNLPELMNLFKEVADIKTADQLNLPTPEVEYHNIVAQPTEHQQEMVKTLSERASLVHSGTVDPSQDNMLKITSDGRKLGLDQRIVNQMLPDEPGTKVNQCADNIMQIWRNGKADKLTQLVFCDISTPQAKAPASKAAKTLDNPLLHALEGSVPLPEQEPVFTVYDDIRQKLIAQGMPADQIAFIHEANTEVRKKELFSKVRTGQVRVLLGSTAKMGAGTNVQDRLVALHDLDCPWRPGDVGRIFRTFKIKKNVEVIDNGKIII